MQMSGLHYAEEDSKQSQVSALPERRVKKQKWTALLGYFFVPRLNGIYSIESFLYAPRIYNCDHFSNGGAGICRTF